MNENLLIDNPDKFSLKDRAASESERDNRRKRLYLKEVIDKENPNFSTNNLILAPVGSGKSHLIENKLIPNDYKGEILYLVSTSALKDSIAPKDNKQRAELAGKGESKGFYTTSNNRKFGNVSYGVHVMTYHEFGNRIVPSEQTFTNNFSLIFCDEIHSVEVFSNYGGNSRALFIAARWLFSKHKDKIIYYFTATSDAIKNAESKFPGYMDAVKVFNYLEYPNIVRYQAKSTYYISNTYQLKEHLDAKINYVKDKGHKGLAFTRRIESQHKIAKIAKESGYTPITLWSENNKEKEMDSEQVDVRDYLLRTGNIPDPYNLLIINSSMQEGWNLNDKYVEFAILDTLDKTERVQALGRIRKDIDFLILKVEKSSSGIKSVIHIEDSYLNIILTPEEKDALAEKLNIKNKHGETVKWRTIKQLAKSSGYEIEDKVKVVNGRRRGVSIISKTKDLN